MRLKEAVMAMDRGVAAEKIGETTEGLVMNLAFGIALIVDASDVDVGNCLNRSDGHALIIQSRQRPSSDAWPRISTNILAVETPELVVNRRRSNKKSKALSAASAV